MTPRSSVRPFTVVRLVAAALVLGRLAGALRTRPPVSVADRPSRDLPTVSVVVPARDEAARIEPLLDAIVGAPGVTEVIVVDDESSDATALVARSRGADVVRGRPRPAGWAGKAWALQQGLDAATSEWVVALDADVRPSTDLPAAAVGRAVADDTDLLTLGGRFECPTAGARWLHPAMLTTLVYRFGPPGRDPRPRSHRLMANGQCTVLRRAVVLEAGGLEPVASHVVEDVALARHLAGLGRRVDFLDAADLVTVRMYETLRQTWSGWGRSIALPGVEHRWRQLVELVALALTLPFPPARLLAGRADALDVTLLLARIGTLAGTRRSYDRVDAAYWLSPAADVAAVAALGLGIVRRRQIWRGRRYPV